MSNEYEKINIHWFPGHMTKAGRMIEENVKLVDAVCEIVDARIPRASRNPDIDRLAGGKPRLIILNRIDLADPKVTTQWRNHFKSEGIAVLETDAKSGKGVANFSAAVKSVLKDKLEAYAAKGQATRPLKVMIVGIPNVGKSTFINKVAGKKAALVSDRPGVTRGRQWISVDKGLDLMDTPGILWPKFDSQEVGELLAVTGAVKDDVLDRELLASNFLLRLMKMYPEAVSARYKLPEYKGEQGLELLEMAARKRGFLISGGELDTERMSAVLLDEFRGGKLGRLSLELPDEQ